MMSDNGQDFVIFARKEYEEPLAEIGTVSAGDSAKAREAALKAYPDDDWLEMVAIPQAVVLTVIESK
jgi:hypothetical protein